ncbi:MAG: hypothetical protein V1853_04305 [bacterium]
MNQPLTKHDLKQAVQEIVAHFNKGQGLQNEQIKEVNVEMKDIKNDLSEVKQDASKIKLAVVDLMDTYRRLHNPVSVFKCEEIKLTERKIFSN